MLKNKRLLLALGFALFGLTVAGLTLRPAPTPSPDSMAAIVERLDQIKATRSVGIEMVAGSGVTISKVYNAVAHTLEFTISAGCGPTAPGEGGPFARSSPPPEVTP